jgi:hypothetical protein
MPLTFNQIVDRIRTLSLSHSQVNDFYFGDPHEYNSNGDITYPAVFLESFPGVVDRANKIQRYTFRMYCYDLVNVAADTEANETEVLSDMSQVADDILAMLFNPVYQDDWIIGDTALKGFGTEKLDDMVAGAEVELTIGVEYLADSCQVPASDVEFPQTIDMPRTKIYKYTATGSEGDTISIPELANKHILALWRAMAYKRPVAVAPTDSEKIQVGTTDMGSGQGILGDGNFILETGDSLNANEQLDVLYYGV